MTDAQLLEHARQRIEASIEVKRKLIANHLPEIAGIARRFARCLADGGKILFCGNGGSAADAQHLAAELLVRLRADFDRRPLPSLALALDSSSLTACANDYGFEHCYERMVRALGRPGDILAGLTTSGKSPNIVRALTAARELNLVTIGFLGGTGGPARGRCDACFIVPSEDTGRIQEAHITAGHVIIEAVEDMLRENGTLESAI